MRLAQSMANRNAFVDKLYNRMMDSGETAQAAPKGKRSTLRQKNRILDETLESDSTDEAKSFRYKDRAHEHFLFVRFF